MNATRMTSAIVLVLLLALTLSTPVLASTNVNVPRGSMLGGQRMAGELPWANLKPYQRLVILEEMEFNPGPYKVLNAPVINQENAVRTRCPMGPVCEIWFY